MPGLSNMNFSKTVNPLKDLQLATQSQQTLQNSYFNLLKWQPEAVQFKSGTELEAPDDEYNKSPWRMV